MSFFFEEFVAFFGTETDASFLGETIFIGFFGAFSSDASCDHEEAFTAFFITGFLSFTAFFGFLDSWFLFPRFA